MTKAEIEAFLAVARYGSLSAAAEQIYVTQPALTRRIQSLEKELGYRLFVRGKGIRGSTLSERGRAFLPLARRWNEVWREAFALQGEEPRPVFRLAAIGSATRLLLPALFQGLCLAPEPLALSFHLCHSTEGYSLIEQGSADAVLLDYVKSGAYHTASVRSLPVYAAPFVVVGGEAFRGIAAVRAETLDAAREISLPWNAAFDAWHERVFGAASRCVAFLDDSAAVQSVLQGDLFALMPRTEGLRLSAASEHIHMAELIGGPPPEIIHCLSAQGDESEGLTRFFRVLRAALRDQPGVECLL